MRLLIFGKSGQVACELADRCTALKLEALFLSREQADLMDPAGCAVHIAKTDADVIINAAAYTAVDAAETDAVAARIVNAEAPTAMAEAAAKRGLPFLHISTDYVFDGSGNKPWSETDETNPNTIYGQTKRDGELGVAAANGDYAILRTAWVFSNYGANFVKTMLRVGTTRSELKVIDDQFGGPTPAAAIAEALIVLAEAFHQGGGQNGIYHFAGAPKVSWADFADAIFKDGAAGPKIIRIPTSEYPTPTLRPANSALDCRKIGATFGLGQPDWRVSLKQVLEQLEASS